MGNLMSDCQELVYKGFVPIPEDLEELGDNSPLARYSNASKYVLSFEFKFSNNTQKWHKFF